ncbi:MAG: hypothetical protein QXF41_02875 [Candidatus Micrarchaeaceae archaeon]
MTTFCGCVKGYSLINIVNGTYGAITTPFQQYISVPITPSIQNMISDIRQINFQDGNGNIIPAWLESVSGTLWASASVSAVNYWLKLTSPATISAGATVTVYMCFNSINVMDGIITGCAPQLTSTYAQYDNGTNVFSLYANGNTPISDFTVTSGFTLTQATGVAYGSTTINALKLTGYSSSAGINFYLNTGSLSASQSWIAEGNGQWYTSSQSGDTDIVSLIQSPSSSANAIAVGGIPSWGEVYFEQEYMTAGSYTHDVNPQGSGGQSWVYGSLTYIAGSTTYSGYTAPQLYSTSGGYSGTTTNPISSTGGAIYLGVIGDQISGYPANAYWNFIRVRAYPPNNIMPTTQINITLPTLTQLPPMF